MAEKIIRDSDIRVYQNGDLVNIREFDIGMTLVYPIIENDKFKLDEKGDLIEETDTFIKKCDDEYDGHSYCLHFVGEKADWYFQHSDSSDDPLYTKKASLLKTDIKKEKDKIVHALGVYNLGNEIRIRPRYFGFHETDYGYSFWILNDEPHSIEYDGLYHLYLVKHSNNSN